MDDVLQLQYGNSIRASQGMQYINVNFLPARNNCLIFRIHAQAKKRIWKLDRIQIELFYRSVKKVVQYSEIIKLSQYTLFIHTRFKCMWVVLRCTFRAWSRTFPTNQLLVIQAISHTPLQLPLGYLGTLSLCTDHLYDFVLQNNTKHSPQRNIMLNFSEIRPKVLATQILVSNCYSVLNSYRLNSRLQEPSQHCPKAPAVLMYFRSVPTILLPS